MESVEGAGLRGGLSVNPRGRAAHDEVARGSAAGLEAAASLAASQVGGNEDLSGAGGEARFANRLDFTPSDTLYPLQYQYDIVGKIETVWDEYSGDGVSVGVYDTGIQYTHPDLASNYDASKHVVFDSVTHDGGPAATSPIGHGTHVAGIVVGDAGGMNGVGFAHGALITGVNIFDTTSPLDVNAAEKTGFFAAMDQLGTFDVMNNSWGTDSRFASSNNRNLALSVGEGMYDAFVAGVDGGRDNLGTIITTSAGNRNMDVQGEGRKSGIETIVVAATRSDGFAASYSNFGSNVLVTAPGGGGSSDPNGGGHMLSTDLVGADGYSAGDNAAISGTSMSAPVISGVAALILEANPDLGWRDVQEIIAYSAVETGSGVGAASLGANEDNFWFYNGASNWNGGGLHFSEDYGYGMVDPYNAVRLAEVWTTISAAQTSANDLTVSTPHQAVDINYGATFDESFTFTVTDHLDIEHVTLNLNLDHNQFWQMDIWLTSPAGTEVQLANTLRVAGDEGIYDADDWFLYNDLPTDRTWSYGAQAFRGEDTAGTWTVRIVDNENRVWSVPDAGVNTNFTIDWLQMDFVGSADDNDDHYIYTDEYAALGVGARATLNDTNGGTDAINTAAIAGDSVIDLSGAGASSLDGAALTIAAAVIEHAFAGDGNDRLVDNALDNHLHGGRGDDTVASGFGGDTLDGGVGADLLVFDRVAAAVAFVVDLAIAGDQSLADGALLRGFEVLDAVGGTAGDSFAGGSRGDTLSGGAGDDLLNGRGGDDLLEGGGDADVLVGRTGADSLDGGDGDDLLNGGLDDDTVNGGLGADRVTYADAASAVTVSLAVTTAQDTGGAGIDVLAAIEKLIGSAHADDLTGDTARNVIRGGDGDDTIDGGVFNDLLLGGVGVDVFRISALDGGSVSKGRIVDFETGETLDLSGVDADTNTGGDQAFTVVARFTGDAGQLLVRYKAAEDRTRVMGDVDGDGQEDFILYLNGDQTGFAGFTL